MTINEQVITPVSYTHLDVYKRQEYEYLLQELMDDSIYFIFSIDHLFIYQYSTNHREDEVNFIIVQF